MPNLVEVHYDQTEKLKYFTRMEYLAEEIYEKSSFKKDNDESTKI